MSIDETPRGSVRPIHKRHYNSLPKTSLEPALSTLRYTVRHPSGPGAVHSYAPPGGLQAARTSKGLTREELFTLSGYSVADLKEMESRPEKPVPRIITSRLSGAMQMPHDTLRGW